MKTDRNNNDLLPGEPDPYLPGEYIDPFASTQDTRPRTSKYYYRTWRFDISSPASRFWLCVALVCIGNLLIHLYVQNWQLVNPRVNMLTIGLVAMFVLMFTSDMYRDYHNRYVPSALAMLPSLVGGTTAIITYLADLPGPAEWMPLPDLVVQIELLAMPWATIGQIWILTRNYLDEQ